MKCKNIFSVSDRKVGSATQKLERNTTPLLLHYIHTTYITFYILLLYTSDFHLIMNEYC